MRFAILGPLRVQSGGQEIPVSAGRERAVLAMLLLHADRTVPVERLVEAMWEGEPPPTARNQLQASVSRLRKRFAAAGAADLIVSGPAGYRARIDPEQVDLYEFRAHVTAARSAAATGRWDDAVSRYEAGIGLWRGQALAGIDRMTLRQAAEALEEERTQAQEERYRAALETGAGGELVAPLTDLVSRHPYREGLRAALMRALQRAGRSAEALAEFRRVRELFSEELGSEPGEELQRLHRAILNHDGELAAESPLPATPVRPVRVVPRELPGEPPCFVGRGKELAAIRDAVVPRDPDGHRPPVAFLYGPGGSGKSALAVRVGHELAGEFPDGQLYVDLRGATPGLPPLPPWEVLGRFLRRLGVPAAEVPAEEAEAAALLRSLTADRRLLLVLDNAAGKDQLAPLLPGGPGCGVLITSRHPLPSLDADERIRVGPLPDADSLALLAGLAGRTAREPDAAQAIVSLADGLPLALRIAAGRLAGRPDLPVTSYAQRLADDSRRLDELQLDDLAVRVSIRTSYDALLADGDPAGALAARAFRMLGVLHVPDVAAGVVAAMLDRADPEPVRKALDRLADTQLVEPLPGDRYRLHDLVRLVAAELATEQEDEPVRDRAVERALDYYAAGFGRALEIMSPTRLHVLPVPADSSFPRFDEPVAGRNWADDEILNAVATLRQVAAMNEQPRLPLSLFESTWRRLNERSDWLEALDLSHLALRMAHRTGNELLVGWAYLSLGRSFANLGSFASAAANFGRSLEVMRRIGAGDGVVLTLNALGYMEQLRGDQEAAVRHFEQALTDGASVPDENRSALVHANLSPSYLCLRMVDNAVRSAELSASIARSRGDSFRLAHALSNLAAAHCLAGRYSAATATADEAFVCSQEIGHPTIGLEIVLARATAHLWRGCYVEATDDAESVLASARTYGNRYAEAAALRLCSLILAAAGKSDEAMMVGADADAAYDNLLSRRDPVVEALLEQYEQSQHNRMPAAIGGSDVSL